MSGHLPWAEARLLQGPPAPSPATEQPRLNTAHAQSHRPKPMELFLIIKFNHFHNWFLEVCSAPLLFKPTASLCHLWISHHSTQKHYSLASPVFAFFQLPRHSTVACPYCPGTPFPRAGRGSVLKPIFSVTVLGDV
nr:unknown [Homo sapiens]